MAADDYAIIAGVNVYPGIFQLEGAENDALAFEKWVLEQGVPRDRVKTILSSKWNPPGDATAAQPPADTRTRAEVILATKPEEAELVFEFRSLAFQSAEQARNTGRGPRLGRRLYVFFAGHGLVPDWEEQITALLAANATYVSPVHVAGRLYQRWFIEHGVFDEALLFMDCCSTADKDYPLTPAVLPRSKNPVAVNNPRWFYATASGLALKTREKTTIREGVAHGVFTATLLDALTGKAGLRVTNKVLEQYLHDNMRHYLDDDDKDDPQVAQQPYVQTGGDAFDIVVLPGQEGFPVDIQFRASDIGKAAAIVVVDQVLFQTVVSAQPWHVTLPKKGLYSLKIGERVAALDVTRGDTRVEL
jgi:hypothetical protein